MMYLFGFALSYLLVELQIIKKRFPVSHDFVNSLYSYIIIGLLIGARLREILSQLVDYETDLHICYVNSLSVKHKR